MKHLKYLILLLFTLSTVVFSKAQIKVTDRSAKKTPQWFDKSEQDYIITSAIMPTLDQARDRCMESVQAKIIESVALNINHQTISTLDQRTGSSGDNFSDTFSSSLKTRAATLPYVKGISVSKVEDSYWEKREDKKTGSVSYLYSVRYPFPSQELKKLVREFESQDKDMMIRLEALENGLDSVSSIEQIGRSINDCEPLLVYFFDDVRRARTLAVQNAYSQLYNNIVVQTIEQHPGEVILAFLLGGQEVSMPANAQIISPCASQVECLQEGKRIKVRYSTDNCDNDIASKITLNFRVGGRIISHVINFTPTDTEVSIVPTGTMLITLKDDSIVLDLDLKLQNSTANIKVESLTLNVPRIEEPIVIHNPDITIKGNGLQHLQIIQDQPMLEVSSDLLNIARGSLQLQDLKTGDRVNIQIIMPYNIVNKLSQ